MDIVVLYFVVIVDFVIKIFDKKKRNVVLRYMDIIIVISMVDIYIWLLKIYW